MKCRWLLLLTFACTFKSVVYGVDCRESCWSTEDGYDTYALGGATYGWQCGNLRIVPTKEVFDLNYTLYPGSRPRAGAARLEVVTEPAFKGAIRAEFARIGGSGTKNIVAEGGGAKHIFKLDFPSAETYQLKKLVFFSPPCMKETGTPPFLVKSIDWVFVRTAAGACRVEPERRPNKLPVFTPVGGADPAIRLENTSDTEQEWCFNVVATNYFGLKCIRSAHAKMEPGGFFRVAIPDARKQKGLWYVEVDVKAADGTIAHGSARFAVLDPNPITPRLEKDKFRIGINFHMGCYFDKCREYCLDAITVLGAKMVRGGAFEFSSFQPCGPDDWETARCDEWMSLLKTRGLDVDAIFNYAPRWAQDERHRQLSDAKGWTYGSYSRTLPGTTGNFLEKLARRYGTDIAYYELGNEWDCIDPAILTPEEGVDFLKEAYAGLKRGNPEATLATCGFAYGTTEEGGDGIRQKNMHERVTEEARGFYDVHAVHAHCLHHDFPNRLQKFFEMRERLGDKSPWFLNEAGVSSFCGLERVAAEYVWIKVLYSWARGSRDYIWYNLRATGWDPKDSEQGFGIITPDWNLRPAFASFAALTHLLNGYVADGILSDGDLQVYRFRGDDGTVVLAGWCRKGGEFMKPAGSGSWIRVDLMGNQTKAEGPGLSFCSVPCAYVCRKRK